MVKVAPPRTELILRENGLWAILDRIGNRANVVETGHLDRILAEQDLASWRSCGRLSASGQAWLRAAERLQNMASTRRRKHGGQTVTRTDVLRLLLEQNYACPITGHIFEPVFDGPWQPSLDRLDNARGYQIENLRVVTFIANVAMNTWGEQVLVDMAERIVARGLRPDGEVPTELDTIPLQLTHCPQKETS